MTDAELLAHLPSEWCDTLGASEFTTIPESTLVTMRSKGGGPPFYRIGKRRLVRYTYADLRAWMLSNTREGET